MHYELGLLARAVLEGDSGEDDNDEREENDHEKKEDVKVKGKLMLF